MNGCSGSIDLSRENGVRLSSKSNVLIAIPAYNEEECIESTVNELVRLLQGLISLLSMMVHAIERVRFVVR